MAQATLILNGVYNRQLAKAWIDKAPPRTVVTFRGVKRSIPQNSRLWAMLTDVAMQADWPLGSGIKRKPEVWKDLFTGAVKAAAGGLEIVPGLEGGFMLLGLRTSEMTVAEMKELQDYIEAWGAQNNIVFSWQEEDAA
jgi:hypothetical protein